MTAASWFAFAQPPASRETVERAAGALTRYRVMAFVTGVVLAAGTIALILKESGVPHMEPETGFIWLGHGYFYLIYVMATAVLGVRMRWPLPRFALVMLAGTVPTMSFVAEHYVTRSVRNAAVAPQPVPLPLND